MYGENSGQLRAELTALLRHHRIQRRLGSQGSHTVPETTVAGEREGIGQQIARYRHSVLVWCLQATRATSPRMDLQGTSGRNRGPAEEFHYRLTTALEASAAGLPPLEELSTPRDSPIVESWRHAARAAALGEHDFGAGVDYVHLTEEQCMTVLKDAAETARGLVGLDRRYEHIPGWENLKDQGRLGRAAEVCAAFAGYDEPDYTVDLRGWRPRPSIDHSAPRPGLVGVVQGEYNLLVRLQRFPEAHSMRLVLDSQRIVAHETAARIRDTAPAFAANWEARAETYQALIQETRNVRGTLGNGTRAAAEAAIVATRAQKLALNGTVGNKPLRQLDRLFRRIDTHLADVIEHGASERLYVLRVKMPRVTDQSKGLIQPVRARYVPIDAPIKNDLLEIVRTKLRPPSTQPRPPAGVRQSRLDFEAAITHRPGDTGPLRSL